MSFGSEPWAALIASSTSVSALPMSVPRSNCSVICVLPSTLVEVICASPGSIWPNSVSSGVATVEAMVSGLAPGYCAVTVRVGNSTFGSGATGSSGIGDQPGQEDRRRQQRRRDRAPDERRRDAHRMSSRRMVASRRRRCRRTSAPAAFDRDAHARRQPRLAGHHDALAALTGPWRSPRWPSSW